MIIHFCIENDQRVSYLCNGACGVSKGKLTTDKLKVTCQNCLRNLKNRGELS